MTQTRKDLTFGTIVLAIGLVYYILSGDIPRREGIDSATVPYILATCIIALGVIQIAAALLLGKRNKTRTADPKSDPAAAESKAEQNCDCAIPAPARPDYKTVALTAGLIILYVALLNYFGFLVLSAVYLYVQFIVLTPGHARKRYILYAFIAALASSVIYYLFLWAFDIMLPPGNFWYELGIDFEWYPF